MNRGSESGIPSMQPPSGGRIATVAVLVGVLSGQIAIIVASTLRSAEESSDALWRDNLLTLNIFTGCAILFIVAIFLLRLPALLLTRRLKRVFPGAVVYSVANNKDSRLIFEKLLRENGVRAGSPLTLYLGLIADGSGMSFWPTGPRDAKPSFLPWSAVQVVAAGGALDQGRSIPGVIVGVRQGVTSRTSPSLLWVAACSGRWASLLALPRFSLSSSKRSGPLARLLPTKLHRT